MGRTSRIVCLLGVIALVLTLPTEEARAESVDWSSYIDRNPSRTLSAPAPSAAKKSSKATKGKKKRVAKATKAKARKKKGGKARR